MEYVLIIAYPRVQYEIYLLSHFIFNLGSSLLGSFDFWRKNVALGDEIYRFNINVKNYQFLTPAPLNVNWRYVAQCSIDESLPEHESIRKINKGILDQTSLTSNKNILMHWIL